MRYLLAVFAFVVFSITHCTGQEASGKQFILTGTVNGRDTGYLILSYFINTENSINDTTYLKNGKFTFKGQIDEPICATIKGYPKQVDFNEANYVDIFLEPTLQHIELKEDNYSTAKMYGSHTQKIYAMFTANIDSINTKYKKTLQALLKAKYAYENAKSENEKDIALQQEDDLKPTLDLRGNEIMHEDISFVKQHLDSYASPFIFYYPATQMSIDSAEAIFHELDANIQKSIVGKSINKRLQIRRQNAIGGHPYSFNAKDINNDSISLSQFGNDYVLLDFWASWCAPCREEIPSLKGLYKKYHKNGLEIVAVSIDRDTAAWRKAVNDEQINNWHNVLVNSALNEHYENIHNPIPSQILIAPGGVIVWKSSDKGLNMEDALKKFIK